MPRHQFSGKDKVFACNLTGYSSVGSPKAERLQSEYMRRSISKAMSSPYEASIITRLDPLLRIDILRVINNVQHVIFIGRRGG